MDPFLSQNGPTDTDAPSCSFLPFCLYTSLSTRLVFFWESEIRQLYSGSYLQSFIVTDSSSITFRIVGKTLESRNLLYTLFF